MTEQELNAARKLAKEALSSRDVEKVLAKSVTKTVRVDTNTLHLVGQARQLILKLTDECLRLRGVVQGLGADPDVR